MTGPIVSFGNFQLDVTRLELSEDGGRLGVGARACALLLVLLQRKGEIVSSRDLLKAAWPGVTVEEVNVRVHVTALRKVLRDGKGGARYIHTIPRRGYSFVAEAAFTQQHVSAVAPSAVPLAAPQMVASLVGRGETLKLLDAELSSRRIVTVVGPGGIGKTSVAVAVAAMCSRRNEECAFVDLSTATNGAHVAESLFVALALRGNPEDVFSYVVSALKGSSLLLILDNCDRVVDAVARLVNEVARGSAKVRFLATSREALRAHGEYVHTLGPLETPSSTAEVTGKSILEYSAVRLFVEAARAHADGFRLDDDNAPVIGDICRKLDGIPLALELSAATTDFLTVRELAERIDDRFALLIRGHRTAPPRHRTMLDALEWGHALLSASAVATMRRLAVFPTRFTLSDAVTVAADPELSAGCVLDGIAELQSKSFLTADISGDVAEFRFLETIRAFATTKLGASDERDFVHRRYAMRVLEILSRLRQEKASAEQRIFNNRRIIDDLRAAHNWATSPQGDRGIALHLLSLSSAVWRSLNLDTEFLTRARETLVGLPGETAESLRHEMNVQLALTFALNATQAVPAASFQRLYLASATRAAELAERVGSPADRVRALWALIGAAIENGHHRALMTHAATLEQLTASVPAGPVLERSIYLRSLAYHAVGEFTDSLRSIGVNGDGGSTRRMIATSTVESLASRSLIARNLWLSGELTLARDLRDEGSSLQLNRMNPSDVLFFLTSCAASISLSDRDIAASERAIETLESIANDTGRPGFASYAPDLRAACERLQRSRGSYRSAPVDWSPTTMSLADAMTGIHCSFHRAVDLERIRTESSWAAAEHLRSAGEHALLRGDSDCQERAEVWFRQANAIAAKQGALFWELRAAVSMARLFREQGKADAARQAIASVVGRFAHGEMCADIRDAYLLLSGEAAD